jgi:RNA polymerase sigma factor (sigma-70 family)
MIRPGQNNTDIYRMTEQQKEDFMALYTPVHAQFERFCRARAYGEMHYQDLMQEAVLIACRQFSALRAPGALLSFLCGTAVRVLANHRRKKKTLSIAAHEDAIANLAVSSDWERASDAADLYAALALLPDAQREALELYEITGLSVQEISVIQRASPSAIRQRLVRGRQQLLHILSEKTKSANHSTPKP